MSEGVCCWIHFVGNNFYENQLKFIENLRAGSSVKGGNS